MICVESAEEIVRESPLTWETVTAAEGQMLTDEELLARTDKALAKTPLPGAAGDEVMRIFKLRPQATISPAIVMSVLEIGRHAASCRLRRLAARGKLVAVPGGYRLA